MRLMFEDGFILMMYKVWGRKKLSKIFSNREQVSLNFSFSFGDDHESYWAWYTYCSFIDAFWYGKYGNFRMSLQFSLQSPSLTCSPESWNIIIWYMTVLPWYEVTIYAMIVGLLYLTYNYIWSVFTECNYVTIFFIHKSVLLFCFVLFIY